MDYIHTQKDMPSGVTAEIDSPDAPDQTEVKKT